MDVLSTVMGGCRLPIRPPRSPTMTFTFRAAGQPGGGHWWGPGRGLAQLQQRNLCFLKAPVLGTPTEGIIHLVTSLLTSPREGSFPSSPGKAEEKLRLGGERPGVP